MKATGLFKNMLEAFDPKNRYFWFILSMITQLWGLIATVS